MCSCSDGTGTTVTLRLAMYREPAERAGAPADVRLHRGSWCGSGSGRGVPGEQYGSAEFAGRPLEPVGNAACVQAVTAGAFDQQPVFLRAEMNGFGFDAEQVDKDDVFIGEFADVDLGRPRGS